MQNCSLEWKCCHKCIKYVFSRIFYQTHWSQKIDALHFTHLKAFNLKFKLFLSENLKSFVLLSNLQHSISKLIYNTAQNANKILITKVQCNNVQHMKFDFMYCIVQCTLQYDEGAYYNLNSIIVCIEYYCCYLVNFEKFVLYVSCLQRKKNDIYRKIQRSIIESVAAIEMYYS